MGMAEKAEKLVYLAEIGVLKTVRTPPTQPLANSPRNSLAQSLRCRAQQERSKVSVIPTTHNPHVKLLPLRSNLRF